MSLIKSSVRFAYRTFARIKVRQLGSTQDESVRKVLKALERSLTAQLSSEEQAWVNRIEQRRRQLYRSAEIIQKADFGAGADNSIDETVAQGPMVSSISVAEMSAKVSKSELWALFLFHLVRQFGSTQIVELGSAVGVSASYLSAAQIINGEGRLVTLEGDEAVARLAAESLESLGMRNSAVTVGKFADTLAGVLEKLDAVDFAFVDGHHNGEATVNYYRQILPKLTQPSVIVFDDISWSSSMREGWSTIIKDSHVRVAIDLQALGVCVVEPGGAKYRAKIPMKFA